jgi:hypothetical protein
VRHWASIEQFFFPQLLQASLAGSPGCAAACAPGRHEGPLNGKKGVLPVLLLLQATSTPIPATVAHPTKALLVMAFLLPPLERQRVPETIHA